MQIKELEEKIKHYAKEYYSGNELIPDSEYDQLIEELKALDPSNSLIAGMADEETNSAGYPKVRHILTTGTLSKCMTVESFEDWLKKHPSEDYHCSAKIDGLSIECVYKYDKLAQVISRGNGFYGFDKKVLADLIPAIPKVLKNHVCSQSEISVRGELILPNKVFNENEYFKNLKNPRNAGAGLFNKKVQDLTTEEILILGQMQFFAYDVRFHELLYGNHLDTKQKMFDWLIAQGFKIPKNITCKTLEEILDFRSKMDKVRGEEFNYDGIVIFEKANSYKELSNDQIEKVQKLAVALKFDCEEAIGEILDIEWSLAGSYLTPVAIMTPMQLNGTTVTRASLANLAVINKLGIKIGDKVKVVKSGEIIPQVVEKVT